MPHSLSHDEARLAAMHELEREYTATPPGGWTKAIDRRARWYMLSSADQWKAHARVQAMDLRVAMERGDERRAADALARCQHAVGQWRIERKPAAQRAA